MTSALELFSRMGSEIKRAPSKATSEPQVLVSRELLERVIAQMTYNVRTRSPITAEIAAALTAALQQGPVPTEPEDKT